MTIDQWLALLSDDDASLLRWVFSGKQLMDYPYKPSGTGQLRCRRGDLMRRRPKLEEDRYASFYERYDLNEEMFCKITQASPMAFYYLKSCKVSAKFNVRLAVNDTKLPQERRDRVAALNRPSVLPVDHRTDAVQSDSAALTDAATQRSTLEQLASRHRSGFATRNAALCAFAGSGMVEGYCDLRDLRSMYQLFLERNKCGYRQVLALPAEDNKCINALRGTRMFLVPRATKIRSYKVESGLTSELRYILLTEAGRNIECGAGLILREHQDLFDLYDIRDDEELYEIIRSFVRPDTVHGLEIGTIPLIRLGKTDRKQQMIDLLRDANAELTGEELSQLYSDTYCISKRTVRVNYLRDLKAYVRNGRYSYVESELSSEQQQFIKYMVTDDYVSLPFVAARFAAVYPDASERLINDQSLESLGLEISRELIVKKGVDLKRAFKDLLRSKDSFAYGSPGFGDEVVTHPDFVSVMAAFLRDFTFIECNRDSFVSLKRLSESMHIGYYDLNQYARAMFDFTKPGVPFTVTSLRKQGFTHRLDAAFEECGFDEAFYDSLILNALAQEGIKRTRIGGICIFCRQDGSFSSADAIEYVVKQTGPIELDDLVDVFQNEYGVEMASTDIKRAAEEKNLFYNEDLEMVMPNKEANAAYLRGLISKNRL